MKGIFVWMAAVVFLALPVPALAQSVQQVMEILQGRWQATTNGLILEIVGTDYMLLAVNDEVVDAGQFALSTDTVTVVSFVDQSQAVWRYGFQGGVLLLQDPYGNVTPYQKIANPKRFKRCDSTTPALLC
jgi:hypothetical protein